MTPCARAARWLAGSAALVFLGTVAPAQSPAPIPGGDPSAPVVAPPSGTGVPATRAPASAEVPAAPGGGGDPCESDCERALKTVPPVQVVPRSGPFAIPPAGEGYYSLLDALQGNRLKAPPKYPYPRFALMQPSFFDANWKYLDDPKNEEHDYADCLKRVRLGDCWMFTTGGSVWNRYMDEHNSRLTAADNDYLLTRVRTYGDLWYRDRLRLYAEFIGAYSNFGELPPLPIDVNRADFLNLFVDLKVAELGGAPVYVRGGRQELLFGSQRLVSTVEWANTRRTFQGVRAFRRTEKLDLDAFWVRPVAVRPGEPDDWDERQDFAGGWATYRPTKSSAVDAYYLYLNNRNDVTQQGIVRAPFSLHTFGGRSSGDQDGFLWDFESAAQLGYRDGSTILAAMATAGVGRHWKDAFLTPTFWVYYDWASGDDTPNARNFTTFNQLFAFGHNYLGWADQVGRQNVHDLNLHLFLYPARWVTLWTQYHRFWLDSPRDALYNAAGNAVRRDATGRSGRDVGHEVDFVSNFHLSKHTDVMAGYSYLFGGDFLRRTAAQGANRGVDNGLFYVQWNYRLYPVARDAVSVPPGSSDPGGGTSSLVTTSTSVCRRKS